MDIKNAISELAEKIKNDKDILAKFQSNPAGTVNSLLGINLPEDQLNGVVEGIKAKISLDKAGDFLGGLFGRK